jgi:hypothetical protein
LIAGGTEVSEWAAKKPGERPRAGSLRAKKWSKGEIERLFRILLPQSISSHRPFAGPGPRQLNCIVADNRKSFGDWDHIGAVFPYQRLWGEIILYYATDLK